VPIPVSEKLDEVTALTHKKLDTYAESLFSAPSATKKSSAMGDAKLAGKAQDPSLA
jgi:hypothetical protein